MISLFIYLIESISQNLELIRIIRFKCSKEQCIFRILHRSKMKLFIMILATSGSIHVSHIFRQAL